MVNVRAFSHHAFRMSTNTLMARSVSQRQNEVWRATRFSCERLKVSVRRREQLSVFHFSRLFSSVQEIPDAEESDMLLQEDEIDNPLEEMIPGSNPGFYVVSQMKTPETEFDVELVKEIIGDEDYDRLRLTAQNISVPVALMLLDPENYPSRSRARKACRKANIMIHRGPLQIDETTSQEVFDPSKCQRALVGDRVYPGDILARQTRMGSGTYPVLNHKKPPFDLPVVYEDDHFAIVNKPAGIVVYAHTGGGHGVMTVRAGLPFAVKPPRPGIFSTLRRPQPVHRLDKPTSGLLLIAKTKPAMVRPQAAYILNKATSGLLLIQNYYTHRTGQPITSISRSKSEEDIYGDREWHS